MASICVDARSPHLGKGYESVILRQYDSLSRFVGEIGWSSLGPAIVLATLAGSAASALMAIANQTAKLFVEGEQQLSFGYGLQFLVFMALFVLCRRLSFLLTNQLVESRVTNLRTRIIDKLRRAELEFTDQLDRGDTHARVANNIGDFSRVFQRLVRGVQEIFVVFFCIVLLATISVMAMWLAIAVVVFLVLAHVLSSHLTQSMNRRQNECNARLFGGLYSMFYGFKEVKLNTARNDALFDAIAEQAQEASELRLKGFYLATRTLTIADAAGYVMLGAAVFLLPRHTTLEGASLASAVTLMIFLRPPLAFVSFCLFMMTHLNSMLANLYDLEHQLDQELDRSPPPISDQSVTPFCNFRTILFESMTFSYRDRDGNPSFSVGPLDLELRRGETTFITGGNGAGKSTTLKLLTGLYQPCSGTLLVDGETVPWENIAHYRQMVAAVFSDFFLFDRFYGIDDADEKRLTELLRYMQIDHKVTFSKGQFSTQNLSTGQRKRLALIVSLMEEREVLFLDEWAADQDWHFRDYFYRQILPDLKHQGKTVIAITHDMQYVEVADQVLRLDLGKLDPQ